MRPQRRELTTRDIERLRIKSTLDIHRSSLLFAEHDVHGDQQLSADEFMAMMPAAFRAEHSPEQLRALRRSAPGYHRP